MTKREKKYILARADEYEAWAREEEAEGRRATDPETKNEYYEQANLNWTACNTLRRILNDLEEL